MAEDLLGALEWHPCLVHQRACHVPQVVEAKGRKAGLAQRSPQDMAQQDIGVDRSRQCGWGLIAFFLPISPRYRLASPCTQGETDDITS
jgi:hypothetical protein